MGHPTGNEDNRTGHGEAGHGLGEGDIGASEADRGAADTGGAAAAAGEEARALLARHCPGLDPAAVTAVRGGNAIWPGLSFFAGISFVAYLLVKLMAGTVAADGAFLGQMAVAGLLTAVGGWVLVRARYFFVVLETAEGPRRIGGLSKGDQTSLRALG